MEAIRILNLRTWLVGVVVAVTAGAACTPGEADTSGDKGSEDTEARGGSCPGYSAWDYFDEPIPTPWYEAQVGDDIVYWPPGGECYASCVVTATLADDPEHPFEVFTFDGDGRLVLAESGSTAYETSGSHGYLTTLAYGTNNRIFSGQTQRDTDLDGAYETTDGTASWRYDSSNLVTSLEYARGGDGDDPPSVERYDYTGGEDGSPSRYEIYASGVFATDGTEPPDEQYRGYYALTYGGDGVTRLEEYQYDASADATSLHVAYEYAWVDGRVEEETWSAGDTTYTYAVAYDDAGRVDTWGWVRETAGDDPVSSETTVAYADDGRVESVINADADGAGTVFTTACP